MVLVHTQPRPVSTKSTSTRDVSINARTRAAGMQSVPHQIKPQRTLATAGLSSLTNGLRTRPAAGVVSFAPALFTPGALLLSRRCNFSRCISRGSLISSCFPSCFFSIFFHFAFGSTFLFWQDPNDNWRHLHVIFYTC